MLLRDLDFRIDPSLVIERKVKYVSFLLCPGLLFYPVILAGYLLFGSALLSVREVLCFDFDFFCPPDDSLAFCGRSELDSLTDSRRLFAVL